ncbi:uncharacterized mitochondrial protein AtMg00240-like [Primulina eburnea]|uniref:uncharacterized mitochondrial protein AtMg00240-like n=1 Tax=Primulina eburnea TaxID=1245227 RepID=UPI003C6CA398
MAGARTFDTPMEQNRKYFTSHELDSSMQQAQRNVPANTLLIDPNEYQRLVAVQSLSQFMHDPKASHMDAAIRVVKYIKRSPDQGILLKPTDSFSITAYCDSDWAACPMTRRSINGYCIKLGASLLSWKS